MIIKVLKMIIMIRVILRNLLIIAKNDNIASNNNKNDKILVIVIKVK